ncbi:MAG: hypothetical protein JJD97_01650 [Gemmatimonadaceae bacterium]|nr:hypothetical protein [Gemmatimonadaceae bacterium]
MGLAGGLNAYGFANGDPVNYSDPFGLTSWWTAAATVAQIILPSGSVVVNTLEGILPKASRAVTV